MLFLFYRDALYFPDEKYGLRVRRRKECHMRKWRWNRWMAGMLAVPMLGAGGLTTLPVHAEPAEAQQEEAAPETDWSGNASVTRRGRRLELRLTSEETAELEVNVQVTYKDHCHDQEEITWTMTDYGEERNSAYILFRSGTGMELTNVKVQFYQNGELVEEKDLSEEEIKEL